MQEELTNLYKEQYKKYLNRAKRFLGDWHYAEDCVQEAFENALKYSYTFTDGKSLEAWFNMVFLNTVRGYLSFIRDQGVVIELKTKDHPQVAVEIVDRYEGVIKEEIEEFCKTVSDGGQKKTILNAYFLNGYGAKGTAIACNTTESAVYNLSFKFRVYLGVKYDK